jgi:hypothetical protein
VKLDAAPRSQLQGILPAARFTEIPLTAGGIPMPCSAFAHRSLLISAVIAAAVASLPAQAQAPRPPQLAPGPGQAAPPAPQPPQARPPVPPPAGQSQQAQQPAAPPKPYKPIIVTLAQPSNDPSFVAFRKQLGEIASKKDRAALARLTVNNFFWMGEKGDKADKKKSGIDNLAAAIELDDKDGSGWETLTAAAHEASLEPVPQRKGVMCSPANPTFDEAAADSVAKDTGTDPSEWGYTSKAGVEVRAAAKADAPVIEKLGQILIRIMPEEPPAGAPEQEQPFLRIVTPSGKVGFVAEEFISPLGTDQICYVKDGSGWKIAGYAGND